VFALDFDPVAAHRATRTAVPLEPAGQFGKRIAGQRQAGDHRHPLAAAAGGLTGHANLRRARRGRARSHLPDGLVHDHAPECMDRFHAPEL
jgi:hypothetical protein